MTSISLKSRVMAGLRWSAGLRLLGQLMTWVITIVVIRLLTPGDYGLMGLAEVFVSFLVMINLWGPGSAIMQRRKLSDEELRAVFGFILAISLVFLLVLYLSAPLIARFYSEPKLLPIIHVLALTFLLSGLTLVPNSLLLRDMQYSKIAIIEFCAAICGSITTLLFAYHGMGVWSLVLGYLAIRLATLIGNQITLPFWKIPRFKIKGIEEIVLYSLRVTGANILWYINNSAATVIIGRVLGKEVLGVYGMGIYLASLPMEKVGGIINQVAFPAFSSIQDDAELAGAHFLKATRILAFITFPVFFGISLTADEIVGIFLGAKWLEAALPVQLISLTIPVRMVRNLFPSAANGVGRSDATLKMETVALFAMPLSFLIGSFYGLLGVCLVWVTVFPAVFLLNLHQFVKIFRLRARDVLRAMARPALSSAVMYAVVYAIKLNLLHSSPPVLRLIVLCISGALVYLSMALAFNRLVILEVRQLAKA